MALYFFIYKTKDYRNQQNARTAKTKITPNFNFFLASNLTPNCGVISILPTNLQPLNLILGFGGK
jgi:hypothetical protein